MTKLYPELITLYENALYFHYLGKGYSEKKAQIMAKKRLISLVN